MSPLIKSRERVRSLAEVYTAEREIDSMLNLVRDASDNIESTFLEPACGNGNFLVAILERKLSRVYDLYQSQKKKVKEQFEFDTLRALSSIYGVDICEENVRDAKERLKVHIKDWYSEKLNTKKPNDDFYLSVEYILNKNIILGDMLNGVAKIEFTEFSAPKPFHFKQRTYLLADMIDAGNKKAKPIQSMPIKHYLEIMNV